MGYKYSSGEKPKPEAKVCIYFNFQDYLSWGCLNKVPQTGWLINNRNLVKLWRLGVRDQGVGMVLFWRVLF